MQSAGQWTLQATSIHLMVKGQNQMFQPSSVLTMMGILLFQIMPHCCVTSPEMMIECDSPDNTIDDNIDSADVNTDVTMDEQLNSLERSKCV